MTYIGIFPLNRKDHGSTAFTNFVDKRTNIFVVVQNLGGDLILDQKGFIGE